MACFIPVYNFVLVALCLSFKNFSVWTAIWLPLLLFQGPLLLETFESIIFDLIFDYC